MLTSDAVYLQENLDKDLLPSLAATWSPSGMYSVYSKIRQIRDSENAKVFIAHDPEGFKATKKAPEFYD